MHKLPVQLVISLNVPLKLTNNRVSKVLEKGQIAASRIFRLPFKNLMPLHLLLDFKSHLTLIVSISVIQLLNPID